MVFVLLIVALTLFLVAALAGYAPNGAGWQRINLVALGLACMVAAQLVPLFHP